MYSVIDAQQATWTRLWIQAHEQDDKPASVSYKNALILTRKVLDLNAQLVDELMTKITAVDQAIDHWRRIQQKPRLMAYDLLCSYPRRLFIQVAKGEDWSLKAMFGLLKCMIYAPVSSIASLAKYKWSYMTVVWSALREPYSKRIKLLKSQKQRLCIMLGSILSKGLVFDSIDQENGDDDSAFQLMEAKIDSITKRSMQVTIKCILSFFGSVDETSDSADLLEDLIERVCVSNSEVLADHGVPSELEQKWPKFVVGAAIALQVYQSVATNQVDIQKAIVNMAETVQSFYEYWIWEPSLQLWKILRNESEHTGLGPDVNAAILQQDIESFQRMLSEYVERQDGSVDQKYPILMQSYESQVKSPLKSTLSPFGRADLPRIILIQVQKLKVDILSALSGVDKLLKANQLNFAVFSLGPALAIAYVLQRMAIHASVSFYNAIMGRRAQAQTQQSIVKRLLLEMDRALNDKGQESYEYGFGFFMHHGMLLQQLSEQLLRDDQDAWKLQQLHADLKIAMSPKHDIDSKIRATDRLCKLLY